MMARRTLSPERKHMFITALAKRVMVPAPFLSLTAQIFLDFSVDALPW